LSRGTSTSPTTNIDLHVALEDARIRYVSRNPRSLALYEDACAVMPGGNTRSTVFYRPFPLMIARGEGSRLWDSDDHVYVDLLGEFTAGLFGHTNPTIARAITAALADGLSLSGHTAAEARLARILCDRFPSIDLVRFTNSGTEANLMALATAVAVTGRRKVLVFEGGYHGGLVNFATREGTPVNAPHAFVVGRYNDGDSAARLLTEHGRELAAIIVEPMLGAGGCLPADRSFLELLREGASRNDAILIFDEVMTSRLSTGGLQKILGITPDMTTLGKYIGGGLTFGAFGGRADLMGRYDPRRDDALPHAGTFNNNVVTLAAGVTAMTEIATPEMLEQVNARGDALRQRINAFCSMRGIGMELTGRGSLLTAQFGAEPVRRVEQVGEHPALKELFFFEMLERGFYLARRGMMALSMEVGEEEIDRAAEAVMDFVAVNEALLPRRAS